MSFNKVTSKRSQSTGKSSSVPAPRSVAATARFPSPPGSPRLRGGMATRSASVSYVEAVGGSPRTVNAELITPALDTFNRVSSPGEQLTQPQVNSSMDKWLQSGGRTLIGSASRAKRNNSSSVESQRDSAAVSSTGNSSTVSAPLESRSSTLDAAVDLTVSDDSVGEARVASADGERTVNASTAQKDGDRMVNASAAKHRQQRVPAECNSDSSALSDSGESASYESDVGTAGENSIQPSIQPATQPSSQSSNHPPTQSTNQPATQPTQPSAQPTDATTSQSTATAAATMDMMAMMTMFMAQIAADNKARDKHMRKLEKQMAAQQAMVVTFIRETQGRLTTPPTAMVLDATPSSSESSTPSATTPVHSEDEKLDRPNCNHHANHDNINGPLPPSTSATTSDNHTSPIRSSTAKAHDLTSTPVPVVSSTSASTVPVTTVDNTKPANKNFTGSTTAPEDNTILPTVAPQMLGATTHTTDEAMEVAVRARRRAKRPSTGLTTKPRRPSVLDGDSDDVKGSSSGSDGSASSRSKRTRPMNFTQRVQAEFERCSAVSDNDEVSGSDTHGSSEEEVHGGGKHTRPKAMEGFSDDSGIDDRITVPISYYAARGEPHKRTNPPPTRNFRPSVALMSQGNQQKYKRAYREARDYPNYSKEEMYALIYVWILTAEEEERVASGQGTPDVTWTRIQHLLEFARRAPSGTEFPPPFIADLFMPFMRSRFFVAGSTISSAGNGLFVSRVDMDDRSTPVQAMRFSMLVMGTLSDVNDTSGRSFQVGPNRFIIPHLDSKLTPRQYVGYINDNVSMNAPDRQLTNLTLMHGIELRSVGMINPGDELFFSYGDEYNWAAVYLALAERLAVTITTYLDRNHSWREEARKYGWSYSRIQQLLDTVSTDRALAQIVAFGSVKQLRRELEHRHRKEWNEWRQPVHIFAIFVSVAKSQYRRPQRSAERQQFPHSFLHPRMAAHFAHGLQSHTNPEYAAFDMEEFRRVFEILLGGDPSLIPELGRLKSFVHSPYNALIRFRYHERYHGNRLPDLRNHWRKEVARERRTGFTKDDLPTPSTKIMNTREPPRYSSPIQNDGYVDHDDDRDTSWIDRPSKKESRARTRAAREVTVQQATVSKKKGTGTECKDVTAAALALQRMMSGHGESSTVEGNDDDFLRACRENEQLERDRQAAIQRSEARALGQGMHLSRQSTNDQMRLEREQLERAIHNSMDDERRRYSEDDSEFERDIQRAVAISTRVDELRRGGASDTRGAPYRSSVSDKERQQAVGQEEYDIIKNMNDVELGKRMGGVTDCNILSMMRRVIRLRAYGRFAEADEQLKILDDYNRAGHSSTGANPPVSSTQALYARYAPPMTLASVNGPTTQPAPPSQSPGPPPVIRTAPPQVSVVASIPFTQPNRDRSRSPSASQFRSNSVESRGVSSIRSAYDRANERQSTCKYSNDIMKRYEFNPTRYDPKAKTELVLARSQKEYRFTDSAEYPIETHIQLWMGMGSESNAHPLDVCRVLMGANAAANTVIREMMIQWEMDPDNVDEPAFQRVSPENLEACWTKLSAVIDWLCQRFRVVKSDSVLTAQMAALRLKEPTAKGLRNLCRDLLKLYQSLRDSSKVDCDLHNFISESIRQSEWVPNALVTYERFLGEYRDIIAADRTLRMDKAISQTVKRFEALELQTMENIPTAPVTVSVSRQHQSQSRQRSHAAIVDPNYCNVSQVAEPPTHNAQLAVLSRPPQYCNCCGEQWTETSKHLGNDCPWKHRHQLYPRKLDVEKIAGELSLEKGLALIDQCRRTGFMADPNKPESLVAGVKCSLYRYHQKDPPAALLELAQQDGRYNPPPRQSQSPGRNVQWARPPANNGASSASTGVQPNRMNLITHHAALAEYFSCAGMVIEPDPDPLELLQLSPPTHDLADILTAEFAANKPTNRYLVYTNLEVRPLNSADKAWRSHYQSSVSCDDVDQNEVYDAVMSMVDNGSSVTLCHPDLVRRLQAHVHSVPDINILGVNGSSCAGLVASFVLVVTGTRNIDGHTEKCRRKVLVQAIVMERLSAELLLGGDFITRHNIVCYPDRSEASFFRGDKQLTVQWAPWQQVKSMLVRDQQRSHHTHVVYAEDSIRIEDDTEEGDVLPPDALFDRGYLTGMSPHWEHRLDEPIVQLSPDVGSHSSCSHPVQSADNCGTVGIKDIVAEINDSATLPSVVDVGETVSVTPVVPVDDVVSPPVQYTIPIIPVEEEAENEHLAYLAYVATHCTATLPDLRPPLFPVDLWTYVIDVEKPLVKERWAKYPESRLSECITIANSIRVCEDTEARKEQAPLFRAMILANLDCFCHVDPANPPCIPGVAADIVLKPGVDPVAAKNRPLQIMERLSQEMRCKYMMETGKMEESTSSWNNPTILVPIKDRIAAFFAKHGVNSLAALYDTNNREEVMALFRLVMDFRELNARALLERFPLPLILDLIRQCIEGSNRYSGADIADAYFCILLNESARPYTAFSTATNHLQYRVMPQGLHSAPAIFARIIQKTFGDINSPHLINYFDDIIDMAPGLEDHINTWRKVMERLRATRLTVKPSKTSFNFHTQKVLGYVLSAKGRSTDPERIKAVLNWQKPRNLLDVQHMIGTATFALPYVENMAIILAPLHELNNKKIDIAATWRDDYHGVALDELKHALTRAPVLRTPDPSKKFRIHVDACKTGRGFGAVLLQVDPTKSSDGMEMWSPCAYWSRIATDSERRLPSVELEVTAMHDAIIHWGRLLLYTAIPFEVIVDCYAIVYLVCKMGRTAHSHQRLINRCLNLQCYWFSVTHRKGKEHIDADAMSRLLQENDEPKIRDEYELRHDSGPLTTEDIRVIRNRYKEDATSIIDIINRYQLDRENELTVQVQSAKIEPTGTLSVESVIAHPSIVGSDFESTLLCLACPIKVSKNASRHCNDCNITWGPRVQFIDHVTTLNRVSVNPQLTQSASAKFLERQLWKQVPWHKAAYKSMRIRLLRLILNKICNHQLRMKSHLPEVKELCRSRLCQCLRQARLRHESKYPECRQVLRSMRSSTLRELLSKSSDIQMETVRQLGINEEILRRDTVASESEEGVPVSIKDRVRIDKAYWNLPVDVLEISDPICVNTSTVDESDTENTNHEWPVRRSVQVNVTIHSERLEGMEGAEEDIVPGSEQRVTQSQSDRIITRQSTGSSQPTAIATENRQAMEDRNTRRHQQAEIESERQLSLLEDQHYLHQQHYLHPDTQQLFQIIDTIVTPKDPRTGRRIIKSIAWPIHADGNDHITLAQQRDATYWDVREIYGVNGTKALTDAFRCQDGRQWLEMMPKTASEWLLYQRSDPELQQYLDQCEDTNVRVLLNNSGNKDNQVDYLYRPRLPDETIGPLMRRFSNVFEIKHGNVQHSTIQTFDQFVVPVNIRSTVLYHMHDQMAHPGSKRCLDTIRMKYWWPKVAAAVKLYCHQCRYCELRKANNLRSRVPIQAYRTPLHPFHMVHVDLTGPLSVSEGCEYILLLKDALTKYTIVRKLVDKSMKSVIPAMVEAFNEYGAPRVLLSDQGTEFTNLNLKNVCRLLQIKKIFCTPGNPRSNGLAENAMRTLKDMLAYYCERRQTNWAMHLSTVQHIYNTTINISTGYTPFYLLFGRECPSPDEVSLKGSTIELGLDKYVRGLRDSLALAWDSLGATAWTDKTEVYNSVPRKRLPFKPYQVDQLVYIKRIPKRFYKSPVDELQYHLSSKLQERFSGPFRITACLTPVLYKAMIHGKEKVIHAINMKPARVQLDVADGQEAEEEGNDQAVQQFNDLDYEPLRVYYTTVPNSIHYWEGEEQSTEN